MGVGLAPLVKWRRTSFRALRGRVLAFDALQEIYQFLALVRLPDGRPLTDRRGHVTSHLLGLAMRVTRLMVEYGVRPVFVFDGRPHPLKARELARRRELRERAREEWRRALLEGDLRRAFSKAVVALGVTDPMVKDSMELLELMGVPCIRAPGDAEAQAAHMVRGGVAWAAVTKDYDALLYGAPRVIRHVTFTGTDLLPSRGVVRRLEPEIVELERLLGELGLTREQLVDLAILVGTDFNEGVRGVGPLRALRLIRLYGSIDRMPAHIREELGDYREVRRIFLEPEVVDVEAEFGRPDPEGLRTFLRDRDFSERTISTIVDRLSRLSGAPGGRLEWWL